MDDFFITAASWERRCLGILSKVRSYHAKHVILVAYDEDNPLREEHVREMQTCLERIGKMHLLRATHSAPLKSVRETLDVIAQSGLSSPPRISIDITSFTKIHLLQLLNALDLSGFGRSMNIYYTEPVDFVTDDNQPRTRGISNVRAIETFIGSHRPSKDDILLLFLGYEGARALALWQHLEPNKIFAVIPDPPYKESWHGRTEKQNLYLLSCLQPANILRCHSLDPAGAENLLEEQVCNSGGPTGQYNFFIGPLGTKPQTVGLFRFWRKHRGSATFMYASPLKERCDERSFPAGRTWLIDSSSRW